MVKLFNESDLENTLDFNEWNRTFSAMIQNESFDENDESNAKFIWKCMI